MRRAQSKRILRSASKIHHDEEVLEDQEQRVDTHTSGGSNNSKKVETAELMRRRKEQNFVRDEKNRLKFENMTNGRFIFDELYNKRSELNFNERKKELDYQDEVEKVRN